MEKIKALLEGLGVEDDHIPDLIQADVSQMKSIGAAIRNGIISMTESRLKKGGTKDSGFDGNLSGEKCSHGIPIEHDCQDCGRHYNRFPKE